MTDESDPRRSPAGRRAVPTCRREGESRWQRRLRDWRAFALGLAALLPLAAAAREDEKPAKKAEPWRALHLINYESDKDLETLGGQVPKLAEMGLNVIILEVDYGFQFQAYPKLRRGRDPITPEDAAKLAAVCRKSGVRLIPEFQCLGHQSWKGKPSPC